MAEKLMGRGVPCVISYDLTLTGGAYGIEYFLPGVRTLGQKISEEPSRIGFWAEKFAVFLKELKKVSFEPGELEDISRQFRLWTDRGKDFFSAQEQRGILELFDKIPESRSFACGNIHCGNVLVWNEELFLIDTSDSFMGNPVYEYSELFLNISYALARGDAYTKEKMAVSTEQLKEFWDVFEKKYLELSKADLPAVFPKLFGMVLLSWGLAGEEKIPMDIRRKNAAYLKRGLESLAAVL